MDHCAACRSQKRAAKAAKANAVTYVHGTAFSGLGKADALKALRVAIKHTPKQKVKFTGKGRVEHRVSPNGRGYKVLCRPASVAGKRVVICEPRHTKRRKKK